jgi:hypothetical protein
MTDWLLKDSRIIPYEDGIEPDDIAIDPERPEHPIRKTTDLIAGSWVTARMYGIGFVTEVVKTLDEDTKTWQRSWDRVFFIGINKEVLIAEMELKVAKSPV